MKRICMYLGFATIILGVIGSFALANLLGVEVSYYDLDVERSWSLTIAYFLAGLFVTAVWAAILLGISEILSNFESLEVSAEPETVSHLSALVEERNSSYWKCPQCGKNNASYTGTCGCGCEKP